MVLRRLVAAAALLLPASAGAQATYVQLPSIPTSGAAERLFVADADGDGDDDIYVGPSSAASIDVLVFPGPGAGRGQISLAADVWAPYAGNGTGSLDIATGAVITIEVSFRDASFAQAGAPVSGVPPGGDTVVGIVPLGAKASAAPAFLVLGSGGGASVCSATVFLNCLDVPTAVLGVAGMRAGPLDATGWPDAVVLATGAGVSATVIRNDGALGSWGAEAPLGIPGPHLDAAVADLDGSGAGDVVVLTAAEATIALDPLGGGGALLTVPVTAATRVTVLDADADGALDLAFLTAPGGQPTVEVWRNLGGTFTQWATVTLPYPPLTTDLQLAAGGFGAALGRPSLVVASASGSEVLLFEPVNQPPVVARIDVLPDPAVEGQDLTVTAVASDPEDGAVTAFSWIQDGTPVPGVTGDTLVVPAGSVCDVAPTIDLQVEAFDSAGASSSLSRTVVYPEAPNEPPRIVPFTAITLDERQLASLTAQATDDCTAVLTYDWQVTSGNVTITGSSRGATVNVQAPATCGDEPATLQVTATDGPGLSASEPASLTVAEIVQNPLTVGITGPTSVDEGAGFTLVGSASGSDCTPADVTMTWSVDGVPGSTGSSLTFTAPLRCGGDQASFEVTARDTTLAVGTSAPHLVVFAETFDDAPVIRVLPAGPLELGEGAAALPLDASVLNTACSTGEVWAWSSDLPDLQLSGTGPSVTVSAPDGCGERSGTITVTATNSSGLSDTETRAVTILDSIPDTTDPAVSLAAVEGNPGSVGADGALVVEASGTDNCPGALSGFAFVANRPDGSDASDLVELLPVEPPDPARRRVRNRTCSEGQGVLVATAQDAAAAPNVGRSAPLPLTLVGSTPEITLAQGREVIPRALQASGATVALHAALSCSDPGDQVCFEQLEGPVAALLSADGATSEPGCGRADRVLSIAPKEVPAFLPPYNVLQLEATLVAAGGSTVRAGPAAVEIRLVPDDDLLALVHRADRGRAGPGETVGLEVEIASTLVAPIALEVTLLDALDGLLYVEGSAVGDGVEVVADRATDGGAAIVVTGIPAKGQTAKVRYLAQRSIASEGAITSEVVAFAADSPLSPRAGANAGQTLLTAPGIACACSEGEGSGSAAGVLPWLTLAALALHRRRSRPT